MHFKLMVFLFILTPQLLADSGVKILNGYDPRVDIISENYDAGPFLIYDCEEGHWTCVMESYYQECQAKRDLDNHEKKERIRCAPIGNFPNKKSCFQRQLFMVSQNFGSKVCVGETWKEKEIEY